MKPITTLLKEGVVLGDGGYLIELERRGYVDSGSGREKVGTGKGSGQFTPEVAIENPDALLELHREFLNAGAHDSDFYGGASRALDSGHDFILIQALRGFAIDGADHIAGLYSLCAADQRTMGY